VPSTHPRLGFVPLAGGPLSKLFAPGLTADGLFCRSLRPDGRRVVLRTPDQLHLGPSDLQYLFYRYCMVVRQVRARSLLAFAP
jgi:hypothetical protein